MTILVAIMLIIIYKSSIMNFTIRLILKGSRKTRCVSRIILGKMPGSPVHSRRLFERYLKEIIMKIRSKIIGSLVIMIVVVIIIQAVIMGFTRSRMDRRGNEILTRVNETLRDSVASELESLANTIGQNVLIVESEIDNNMLNAANVLYEVDRLSGGRLNTADLYRLKDLTGMSDLYLGNQSGVFTVSTEPASIGISLFDIWDGYRMLVTGESSYLPSTLKIKVETGEIFKFTAIPRAQGRGVIESALSAESIEKYLQQNITGSNGIKSMNLFDFTGLVLTENHAPNVTSLYRKGGTTTAPEVMGLFKDPSKSTLTIQDGTALIYYPVMKDNSIVYVLFIDVDTEGYFSTARIIEPPLLQLLNESKYFNSLIFFSIIITLFVFALFIAFLVNSLLKPLEVFNSLLKSLSTGDFSVTVPDENLKRTDETGEMSKSFTDTLHNVGEMIRVVVDEVDVLKEAGESLAASSDQTREQVTHISGYVTNVTGKIENQNTSVETMSHSIQEIAENIESLDQLVASQSTVLSQSTSEIEEMLRSIRTVNDTTHKLSGQVAILVDASLGGMKKQEQVEAQVKNIFAFSETLSNTNKVIANISSQTNLLAMNAAIEAAHAGELGRGFAVVASEIRKLAEESASQSKTIGNQLKEIQEGIKVVVSSSMESRESFDSIVHDIRGVNVLIDEASADMGMQNEKSRQIQDDLRAIAELTSQVETSASQMRQESQTILNGMGHLRSISGNVQESMSGVSAGVSEISQASELVQDIASETQTKIKSIVRQIGKFKI